MRKRQPTLNPATGDILWYGVAPTGPRAQWVLLQAGVRTDQQADALDGTLVIAGGDISVWQGGKLIKIGSYTPATAITVTASVSGAQVTLSWAAVSGATYYDVVLDGVYHGRTSALSYVITGMTAGAHSASVTASNNQQGTVSFTIVAVAPPAPANLSAVPTGPTTLSVNWSANPAPAYRNIEVYVNGAFAASAASGPVSVSASGSATVTARAVSAAGLSSPYSTVNVTMPAERIPTGATASSTVQERNP